MAQIFNESIVFRDKDEGIFYLGQDNKYHSSFIPISPSGNLLIGYGNFKDSSNTGEKATYIDGSSIYLRWTDRLNLVSCKNNAYTTLYKFNNDWSSFERKAYFNQGLSVRNQRAYFNKGLSSYNEISYLYKIRTRGLSIVNSENDPNPVSLKKYIDNRIANHFAGSRVFYATCYSGSEEKEKKVRLKNPAYIRIKREDGQIEEKFVLRHGDQLVVNFGYGNDAPSPILKLYNGDSNYEISTTTDVGHEVIVADKSTTGLAGAWSAGEIVTFTYVSAGQSYYWKINNAGGATRTRYGVVKLMKYWTYHEDITGCDRDTTLSVPSINNLIVTHNRRLRLTTEIGATEYNSAKVGKQKVTIHLIGYDKAWNVTEIDRTSFYRHLPVTKTSQLSNTGGKNNTENITGKNIDYAHYFASNYSITFDSYSLGIGYRPRYASSTDGKYVPDGNNNKVINFLPYDPYGNVKLGHGSFKNDYKTADPPTGSSWRIQKPQSYTKIYGHYIRLYIQSNGRDDSGDLHIDGMYYPYGNTKNEPTIVKLYQFSGTKMRFPPVNWSDSNPGKNHRVVFSFSKFEAPNGEYRPLLDVYNGIRTGHIYTTKLYMRQWDKNKKEYAISPYRINGSGEAYLKYMRLTGGYEGVALRINSSEDNNTIKMYTNGTIEANTLKVKNIMVGTNKNTSLSDYIKNVAGGSAIIAYYIITFDKVIFDKSSNQMKLNSKDNWVTTLEKDITSIIDSIYTPIGIIGTVVLDVDSNDSDISHPSYINIFSSNVYIPENNTDKIKLSFRARNFSASQNTVKIRFKIICRRKHS